MVFLPGPQVNIIKFLLVVLILEGIDDPRNDVLWQKSMKENFNGFSVVEAKSIPEIRILSPKGFVVTFNHLFSSFA